MAEPTAFRFDQLLQSLADAGPQPWRPAAYAREHALNRDELDASLNRLRIAGYVRLTDWEPLVGQGYVLTDAGRAALRDERALARLQNGDAEPPAPVPRPRATSETNFERGEKIRAAVFDWPPAYMTRALIAAQVIVFAAGLYFALRHKITLADYLSTGRSPILEYLAVSPPLLAHGDWWVLITSAFVHIGGLHLAVNLFSHGALAPAVEGMFGSVRLLVIWLLSAFGGSVAVAALHQAAAGSSGAICGLIGAQAAFVALYHRHIGRRATQQFRAWLFKSIIIIVVISAMPRVSWAAHLGGAIGGFLAGAFLAVNRFGPAKWRPIALLGVIAIPAFGVAWLLENNILIVGSSPHQMAALETADFDQRVRPLIGRVENQYADVEDNLVEPLRGKRPKERAPEQVKEALRQLDKVRSEESAVLGLIQTGQYRTPEVESARVAAAKLLDLRAKAAALYEECLRRGELWTVERDENMLQQILNAAVEADILYHRAVRGL